MRSELKDQRRRQRRPTRSLAVWLLLVGALAVVSCSGGNTDLDRPPDQRPNMTQEGKVQYDFQEGSIQIPEGWTDLTINELSSSDEDGFVFQVIRNDSQGEASPRDAMEIAKGQMQTLLGEGMEITADNDLDLSGKPAANLEYRNNSDDPVTVGRMVIVFHQDGKSIMFSASSPVSVWGIHAPEVEEAITSFVVRSQ